MEGLKIDKRANSRPCRNPPAEVPWLLGTTVADSLLVPEKVDQAQQFIRSVLYDLNASSHSELSTLTGCGSPQSQREREREISQPCWDPCTKSTNATPDLQPLL